MKPFYRKQQAFLSERPFSSIAFIKQIQVYLCFALIAFDLPTGLIFLGDLCPPSPLSAAMARHAALRKNSNFGKILS
jgi:hypothetical protein